MVIAAAWAQSGPGLTWAPILEVRARIVGETGASEGLTVANRARVGLEVQRGWLSAGVSFQETRSWSRTDDTVPGGFTPHIAEGWVQVDASLSENVGAVVTVGRQPIIVHEGRLVGAQPWEMDGQFLDALRVEARAAPFQLEYVNARRFDLEGEDPLGFGVNVLRVGLGRRAPVSAWQVDLLSVVDARRTEETTTTLGGYARVDVGRVRSRAELYLQANPEGAATLFSGRAGGVLGADEALQLGGEVTLLSGDPASPLVPFRPVLGDTHTFLGRYGAFADGAEQGLGDLALYAHAQPWRALAVELDAHHFGSRQGWQGVEVDLLTRWWFSPFGAIELGGAWFVGPDRNTRWGYLDLDVAF